jgi:hypothetical protein
MRFFPRIEAHARDSWPGTPASRQPSFEKTKHVVPISAGGTPNAPYFLQITAWITFVFAAITLKRAARISLCCCKNYAALGETPAFPAKTRTKWYLVAAQPRQVIREFSLFEDLSPERHYSFFPQRNH